MATEVRIKVVPTTPIEGQKTGTSGLRKKVSVFQQEHYLENFVQSVFNALGGPSAIAATEGGFTLVLGGDGRYFNDRAIQVITRMAAANGVSRLLIGQNGILSTPAVSAIIRSRHATGGIILTASHNPGGPTADWGIKYNGSNGGPAPESFTDRIFAETKRISEYRTIEAIHDFNLAVLDTSRLRVHDPSTGAASDFSVQIIDSVDDYVQLMRSIFDFDALRALVKSGRFSLLFDSMHGVTGVYTTRIFVDELGAPPSAVMNNVPLSDFGGGHPDPNLTYAPELVARMLHSSGPSAPDLGAASDGDGDRNMVLGAGFFVTPSDSVALIAEHAKDAIPYFATGLKGLARSMPTSTALDRVAAALGVEFNEVPTGWKFFGNLMDAGRLSVCGEESFGTGSDHIREKDGVWAVLAWLSLLAHANRDRLADPSKPLVSVADLVRAHWKRFGRSFYVRYDYEECESAGADKMMAELTASLGSMAGRRVGDFEVASADSFTYRDPVDGSVSANQGIRIFFTDGSRAVFRLSGTGSSGATVRVYMEKYAAGPDGLEGDSQEMVKSLAEVALQLSKLREHTGRDRPTVIT